MVILHIPNLDTGHLNSVSHEKVALCVQLKKILRTSTCPQSPEDPHQSQRASSYYGPAQVFKRDSFPSTLPSLVLRTVSLIILVTFQMRQLKHKEVNWLIHAIHWQSWDSEPGQSKFKGPYYSQYIMPTPWYKDAYGLCTVSEADNILFFIIRIANYNYKYHLKFFP